MWRRRTIWLILFVIAVLAVSFTLIPDRVRAPNVSPPPETANEDSEAAPGDASGRDAETDLEDARGREEAVRDNSRPESGPDPEQPESDGIRITGRLIWTAPGGHEDYTSLERMGATVDVWFWSDEHPDAGVDINDAPVDADGSFSIDVETADNWEPLLAQGLSFDLRIGFEADGDNHTVSRKVEPTVRGRVLDFGEIAFGLGDTLHEGSWVVTGRLLSPGGTPFARQSTFNLLCFRDSWPMPIYVQTDSDGWFVETYELATVHGQHESPLPPMQESDWWLDIGDTGYTVEEIWNFEDALIEMPQPAVDRDNREVSFGEVTIDASTVTVKVSLSEKARRALRNEGEDSLISIDLSMANVDDGYRHILRHDRESILCVLPGRYAIKAEFQLIPADDYDPSGGTIVYPESSSELPTLPNSGDWAVQHEILNVGPGEHKVLELKVEPVREVRVHVNTPDGPATSADLRLVQDSGAHYLGNDTHNYKDCPLPINVRSRPDVRETLAVSVDGYAPTVVEIPRTGSELTIDLEPYDPVSVPVRFSGAEIDGHPAVTIRAEYGPAVVELRVADFTRPEVIKLTPGIWQITVVPADTPDGESLIDEVALEVRRQSPVELLLPPLDRAPESERVNNDPPLPGKTGVVRVLCDQRPQISGNGYRNRLSLPDWVLHPIGEPDQQVKTISPWDDKPVEWTMPAGEYEFRAAYGRSARRPIGVTVVSGMTVDVRLPVPEAVPANGRVLLPLPEGVFGWVDVQVDWPGRHSGDWLSYWNRERIVDGKLLVDGLLVGEPIKLTVELSCYGNGNRRTWLGETAEFVLTDSEQTPVDVEWVIED